MNHEELRRKALTNRAVRSSYDNLLPEYSLLKRMLLARHRAGLTQAEIARRMGTKAPAIVRLEKSLESGMHSPSIDTIKKYAKAVNCRIDIKLVAA